MCLRKPDGVYFLYFEIVRTYIREVKINIYFNGINAVRRKGDDFF